jgi:hypothetical protein
MCHGIGVLSTSFLTRCSLTAPHIRSHGWDQELGSAGVGGRLILEGLGDGDPTLRTWVYCRFSGEYLRLFDELTARVMRYLVVTFDKGLPYGTIGYSALCEPSHR